MEPVFPFDVILPARGEGAIAQALHQQLRAAILDGRMSPGSPLPATRRAAAALGVARNTVVAAYDLLVAEGYALPRAGAKAIVADVAIRRHAQGRRMQLRREDPRINRVWRRASQLSLAPDLPQRSFRLGIPEHRHFPHETWRRLVRAVAPRVGADSVRLRARRRHRGAARRNCPARSRYARGRLHE
jgi:GntR family transcriptional regulator/MocR family aminotransferase